MTKAELLLKCAEALEAGEITAAQGRAIEVILGQHANQFGSADLGAIDWQKLLDMVQKLLPVIVQLLPIILAIFTPKQPPEVAPNPPVTIGVK